MRGHGDRAYPPSAYPQKGRVLSLHPSKGANTGHYTENQGGKGHGYAPLRGNSAQGKGGKKGPYGHGFRAPTAKGKGARKGAKGKHERRVWPREPLVEFHEATMRSSGTIVFGDTCVGGHYQGLAEVDGTNGRHVHWSTRACHHRAGDVLRQLCQAGRIEGTRVSFSSTS